MEIKNGELGYGSDLVVRVRCLEYEEELVVFSSRGPNSSYLLH